MTQTVHDIVRGNILRNTNPNYTPNALPFKNSASSSFSAGLSDALENTIESTAVDFLRYKSLADDEDQITEEEFKQGYQSVFPDLEFDQGMSRAQADFRFDRRQEQQETGIMHALAVRDTSDFIAYMGGGFASSFLSPTELALMFALPASKAFSIFKGVQRSTLMAKDANKARRLVETVRNSRWNKMNRMQRATRAGGATAAEALATTTAIEGANYAMKAQMGESMDPLEMLTTIAFSTALGTAAGSTAGFLSKGKAGKAADTIHHFDAATGNKSTEVIKAMAKHDPKYSEAVKAKTRARNGVKDLYEGKAVDESIADDMASLENELSPIKIEPAQFKNLVKSVIPQESYSSTESLMSNVAKEVFGVDVRFVESAPGTPRGRVYKSMPNTTFVRRGDTAQTMFVVGHEVGHTIKYRDPQMWKQLADYVADNDVVIRKDGTTLGKAATQAVFDVYGDKINDLSRLRILDESLSNVLGEAFTHKEFWDGMKKKDTDLYSRMVNYVSDIFNKVKRFVSQQEELTPEGQQFMRDIGEMMSAFDPSIKEAADFWDKAIAKTKGRKAGERQDLGLFQLLGKYDKHLGQYTNSRLFHMTKRSRNEFYKKLDKELDTDLGNMLGSYSGALISEGNWVYSGISVPISRINDVGAYVHRLLYPSGKAEVAKFNKMDLLKNLRKNRRDLRKKALKDSSLADQLTDLEKDIQYLETYDPDILRWDDKGDPVYRTTTELIKSQKPTIRTRFMQPGGAPMGYNLESGQIVPIFVNGKVNPLVDEIRTYNYAGANARTFERGIEPEFGRERESGEIDSPADFDPREEPITTRKIRNSSDQLNKVWKDYVNKKFKSAKDLLNSPDEEGLEFINLYMDFQALTKQQKQIEADIAAGKPPVSNIPFNESMAHVEHLDTVSNQLIENDFLTNNKSLDADEFEVADELADNPESLFSADEGERGKEAKDLVNKANITPQEFNARVEREVFADATAADQQQVGQLVTERLAERNLSALDGLDKQLASKPFREVMDSLTEQLDDVDTELAKSIAGAAVFKDKLQTALGKMKRMDVNFNEFRNQLRDVRGLFDENIKDLYVTLKQSGPEGLRKRVDEDYQSTVLDIILRDNAQTAMSDKMRSPKSMLTWLDGVFRKGAPRIDNSVAHNMHIRVNKMVTPIVNALEEEGMLDMFRRDMPIVDDVLNYVESGTIRSGHAHAAGIKRVGDLITATNKVFISDARAAGSKIREKAGFTLSHKFDAKALRDVGLPKFREFMLDESNIDWDATFENMGGVMWDRKTKEFVPASRQAFVERVYNDAVEGRLLGVDELNDGDLSKSLAHHRVIEFQPGAYTRYTRQFADNKNVSSEFLSQLSTRAKKLVALESFGSNHKENFNIAAQKAGFKGNNLDYKMALGTLDELTADNQIPVDVGIADIGTKVRKLADMALLGKATISSLVDVATAGATFRWAGLTTGQAEVDIIKSIKNAAKRDIKGDKSHSAILRANGAALDALLGSYTRRIGGDTALGGGLIDKAHNLLFNINGLNFQTRVFQEGIVDLVQRNVAERINAEPTVDFVRGLQAVGLKFEDLSQFGALARKLEGTDDLRLMPEDIPDPEIRRKYRVYLDEIMRQAVLEPAVSDRALFKMGTRPGTVYGEAVRSFFKYWQLPNAVLRKTYGRFLHGYGLDTFTDWKSRGFNGSQYDAMVYTSSAIFFGWLALNIKEVSSGREPVHFLHEDQRNTANMQRVLDQSGTMGTLANVLQIFQNPENAAGTVGAPVVRLGSDVVDGNFYGTANSALTLTPFNTLPGVHLAVKNMMAAVFSDLYGETYQKRNDFYEREFGQSAL